MDNIILRVGGKAGTGLVTATDIIATVAMNLGYHVFSSKDYASQIRGGHNYHTIRISKEDVNADVNKIDLLIALDQLTLDKHLNKVKENGIIILSTNLKFKESNKINFISINLSEIETQLEQKNLGNEIDFIRFFKLQIST